MHSKHGKSIRSSETPGEVSAAAMIEADEIVPFGRHAFVMRTHNDSSQDPRAGEVWQKGRRLRFCSGNEIHCNRSHRV